MNKADQMMDTGAAKYEFYMYADGLPGVHIPTLLKGVLGDESTATYWSVAKLHAELIHKAWLAA